MEKYYILWIITIIANIFFNGIKLSNGLIGMFYIETPFPKKSLTLFVLE